MLGGAAGAGLGLVAVSGGLQLGRYAGREAVAGADRGDQAAGGQFAECGVRVGVADQGGQMRLVRDLAAEGDGEPQGGAGGGAQPGGEQRRGRGGLAERGQRHVVTEVVGLGGVGRGHVLEDAELVDGAGAGAQPVALPEQGAGLDEAQRQALGLEPEVTRPVGLVLGEGPADGVLQQVQAGRALQSAEEDLLDAGVGGGGRHVRGGAEQEGALGGRLQQLVERGAAELQVVEDDDRADLPHVGEQLVPVRAVQRGAVHRVEQVVQQVAGGASEAVEADDSVGGEVGAVLGDEVEEAGAAGAGRAGEAGGAAAGQQAHQVLAFVLAGQQRQGGLRGAGRHRRAGRAVGLGAFGRGELHGPGGPFGGRADLYLAAVDGVDGQQEVAGDELHRAGERRRVLREVGCEGFPGRALARRGAVTIVAVLLGSLVVRIHRSSPPKACVCLEKPLPALLHTALSLLVRSRRRVSRQRAAEP